MEKWLTPPLVISLVALCLSIINSAYTRKRDSRQDIEILENRIAEAEASLRVLKMQMELFWKTVEQQMAKKFRDD